MTKVQIFRHDGAYSSFCCSGHADYAEEGSDIVCAGISAIVINTVNCLTDLCKEDPEIDYSEADGDIVCNFRTKPGKEAAFLIDCMIHGFDWIISSYGKKYLSYEIKEV